ncbi:MAG: hypothetical protein NW202_16125 [Nitrospira sp.]|nr:hypothetical protein [Nitrospira sp.]
MTRWLGHLWAMGLRIWRWLRQWLTVPAPSRWRPRPLLVLRRRVFAQPKPTWVKQEVIRLKALMPQAGRRMIAHTFNRRWKARRQMTVSVDPHLNPNAYIWLT